MCRAVCNFIIFQLPLDFFVGTFLFPRRFSFFISYSTTETPHRTKVRFQNEENAPVVLSNKKFLFSKDESRRENLRDTAMETAVKALGCGLYPRSPREQYLTRISQHKKAWNWISVLETSCLQPLFLQHKI